MKFSPWSKNFCASGFHVATGRVCLPSPLYRVTLDVGSSPGLADSASRGPKTLARTSIAAHVRMNRICELHPVEAGVAPVSLRTISCFWVGGKTPSIIFTFTNGMELLQSYFRVALVFGGGPQLISARPRAAFRYTN